MRESLSRLWNFEMDQQCYAISAGFKKSPLPDPLKVPASLGGD
jgi:hypothetical protein